MTTVTQYFEFATTGRDTPVAILGAGSWGTALAILLGAQGRATRLWARDRAFVEDLARTRENRRYLPSIALPDGIAPTENLARALADAPVVVFAVPSGALRQVAEEAAPFLRPDALLVSASKGLEEGTGLRMSETLADALGAIAMRVDAPGEVAVRAEGEGVVARVVALSGPNLAVEVARGIPTASVAASTNPHAARAVQRLFAGSASHPPTFRVYTSGDVIGVELGGAIKNVIAIGAGVCDGLGYGDNAKAGLMTRGLTEAVRLGVAQGASAMTFLGLSGVGDLIATGASRLSRNYRVGFGLGRGQALEAILAEIGQVAEGVPTTRVVCALATRSGVEMPLCDALRRALFESHAAPDIIRELMQRPPKSEDGDL